MNFRFVMENNILVDPGGLAERSRGFVDRLSHGTGLTMPVG